MFKMFRLLPLLTVCVGLSTANLGAQETGHYRAFALGTSVETVTTLAQRGTAPVQTTSERPALIQTMLWRPPYVSPNIMPAPAVRDPVKQIVFSFYDNQLYRMVVDYDSDRTRGMTSSDFVDALSAVYGPTHVTTGGTTAGLRVDGETNAPRVIGQWDAQDASVVAYQEVDLYTGPAGLRFKLVVSSPRLEALNRVAAVESARQNELEAPQREVDRQRKQAADEQAAQEKARTENKAAFRP